MRRGTRRLAVAAFLLAAGAGPSLAGPPDAAALLGLIEANGGWAFAEAEADLAEAEARLAGARARLMPSLTLAATGKAHDSEQKSDTSRGEVFGTLEVIQPLYDFGQTHGALRAAEAGLGAAEERRRLARETVLLEGLALFFDLHVSELLVQSLNEQHASAYVRWERAVERRKLGQTDDIEVADWLARVEATRLDLRQEQARNGSLRLRLAGLTGEAFDGDLISPPVPPAERPAALDAAALVARALEANVELKALAAEAEALREQREGTGARPRIEAFGGGGYSTRDIRGRDQWAVGARVAWPIFDGGLKSAERAGLAAREARALAKLERKRRDVEQKVRELVLQRDAAWQQVVAARARWDHARRFLLQRQQLYQQERVADLGNAMIDMTRAEADLARSAGAFRLENARLAVLLGEPPARALDPGFPDLGTVSGQGGYAPPPGGGYEDVSKEKKQDG